MSSPLTIAIAAFSLVLSWFVPHVSLAVDDFNALLLPGLNVVEVDSLVEIRYEVDSTAVEFNGYTVTVQYDPDIVAFDSVTEGDSMIAWCGNRFRDISTTDSTVTYQHVLMGASCGCPSGPGELAVFRFQALATGSSPLTITTMPDAAFFCAGVALNPTNTDQQVIFHDSEIIVFDPAVSVDDPMGPTAAPAVRVYPNPTRTGATFTLRDPLEPLTISIIDPTGRRIRSWRVGSGTAPSYWDGRDGLGREVPAGTYFFVARGPDTESAGKLQVVR